MEFASSRSREKESILLRDLKLGGNHIDREQLRRNGLWSPRYPTLLRQLNVTVEDSVSSQVLKGVELYGETGTLFKVRCVAVADVDADLDELEDEIGYKMDDGSICRTILEEWCVYRSFKDFQILHKHLKSQVSASESSGTPGSRLVGAATAAFAAANNLPGRARQRQPLIPSLSQVSKVGALGTSKKAIAKRREALDAYVKYLTAPGQGHLLSRCSELMVFLGAAFPLPSDLQAGRPSAVSDSLGRTEMKRSIVVGQGEGKENLDEGDGEDDGDVPPPSRSARAVSSSSAVSDFKDEDNDDDLGDDARKSRKIAMIPGIRNKIEDIHLSQVRNRLFELLRYQFGFENASFIRNRMLAAIKTASFAVTSNSEFQKTLYKIHTEQLSADALAGWIKFTVDMIWPDGVFFKSAPPTSQDVLESQSKQAKELLHASFPEQLRAVLGHELTQDGLDLFHEMLQNRVVVKSMAYMLFDLLWLEIFPEIGDVLECGSVLDIHEGGN